MILKCRTDLETGEVSKSRNMMYINIVQNFISENLPNAILKDKHQQTLFYQIIFDKNNNSGHEKQVDMSIAQIFSLIENNKEYLSLETYSLSQTSLEQVFLTFAQKQNDGSLNSNRNSIAINMSDNENENNKRTTSRTPNSFSNKGYNQSSISLKEL